MGVEGVSLPGTGSCIKDLVVTIISTLFYLAEIGLDIYLIYAYSLKDDWTFFWVTLISVAVPFLITAGINISWIVPKQHSSCTNIILIVCSILLIGRLPRYCAVIYYKMISLKTWNTRRLTWLNNKSEDEKSKIALLSGWEGLLESFPGLVTQLFIIVFNETSKTSSINDDSLLIEYAKQISAILLSLFSLTFTLTGVKRSILHSFHSDCSWTIKGVLFLANCFAIYARGIALGLFASVYHWIVGVVAAIHWIISLLTIYLVRQHKLSRPSNDRLRMLKGGLHYNLYLSLTYTLFPFKYIGNGSFYYRVAYLIFLLENSVMLVLWAHSVWETQSDSCWFWVLMVSQPVSFIFGAILTAIYYRFF